MFKHLRKSTNHSFSQWIPVKYLHAAPATQNLVTFQAEIKNRFDEAKRSVLIETPTVAYNHLVNYCSQFGKIQMIYSHETKTKNYYLIEFKRNISVNDCLASLNGKGYNSELLTATRSRFLKFENFGNSSASKRNKLNMAMVRESHSQNNKNIMNYMSTYQSVEDQIKSLYKMNSISDLSCRLRFLTALQFEEAASAFFSNAKVIPFGSSVNGLGRMQSDVDMVLVSEQSNKNKQPLQFLTKSTAENRSHNEIKNNLQLLSTIMRNWLPGIDKLEPILNARVPIVKFKQSFTNLDCDLSMANLSGHQMSDLFFTFGQIDNRVRPLIFFIRRWAEECGVTRNVQPSPHITNFMLSCLVIFFLQQVNEPILPPAKLFLQKNISPKTDFITDISVMKFKTSNTLSLHEILVEFFTFYSSYNFEKNGINLIDGQIIPNNFRDSIYIRNPLDGSLNVCRNVIDYERDKFIEQCKLALKALVNDKFDAVQLIQSCTKIIDKDSKNKNDLNKFVDLLAKSKNGTNETKTIKKDLISC